MIRYKVAERLLEGEMKMKEAADIDQSSISMDCMSALMYPRV